MFQSFAVIHNGRRMLNNPPKRLVGILFTLVFFALTSHSPAQNYQTPMAPHTYPTNETAAPANYSPSAFQQSYAFPIEQTAYGKNATKKDKKPLHHQIAKMPQADEDLEVIHHRSQLVVTRSRISRLFIADPSVIDVVMFSPNEITVLGTQMGTTNLTLWFEGDASTDPVIYRVEVIRDPSLENQQREDYGKLERDLQVLFPNSQVYLVPLTNRVIVKGQARDQEEAAQIMKVVRAEWIALNANGNGYGNGYGNGGWGGGGWGGGVNGWDTGVGNGNNWNNNNDFIINMLEVPGEQQVMVHVRIAQLDRSQLRRFGIDLSYLINQAGGAAQVISGSVSPAAGSATLSGIFEKGEINLLIDWLASNRTAKIIANPSITVMNGTTGSFISGGEFAVPTIVGIGGAQGTTTTFRGFGTSLIVTPTIIDKDLIRLRIVPEFSAINSNNASGGVPGLDTRRVTSVVQLREGQTIALAGLFSHQTAAEVTRMPFLGELPYIGPRLFNAKEATQGETELLFLVTPEIVRPMEQDEVPPSPGFYVTRPNDFELFKYAMTEGAPDLGVYSLNPYGWGPGMGTEIGYRPYNPALGAYPPGPANGIIGGSLQGGGMQGGFSFPGSAMPGNGMNGGYPQPMMTPPAPSGGPIPMPDPAVRFSPHGNNPLLNQASAESISNQQRPSWNPFKRNHGIPVSNGVQPTGYNSPRPTNGSVQPAGYQAPRGRY